MNQKAFVLQNRGMHRDLSISKAGDSSAYENHNIRILARDHDTLLSVTNERGNKLIVINGIVPADLRITEDEELRITEDELYRIVGNASSAEFGEFKGILIGWNVLNEHIILFTNEGTTDRIYHVIYEDGVFRGDLLFEGFLNFDLSHPIESVVYHETDDLQKIYWVDGKNVLRFLNFAAKPDENGHYPWQNSDGTYDETYFDSNRAANFGVKVDITKDNSGSTRANGVVQYLLTYYNKHGQETGYVWVSDLVYLSPLEHGGAADDKNSNSVKLTISNLDTRFSHFRVYSIFRSALNGTVTSYLVEDTETYPGPVTVVDDGAHLTAEDANRLLYLGSQPVHAWTLTHKDQTLFLGDLQSVGHDFWKIERTIKNNAYYTQGNLYGISKWISFDYSDDSLEGRKNIPYVEDESTYSYENQLRYTSSEITTFKGGEKYRFALKFQLADGTESPAFWIGDAENNLYPQIDEASHSIRRAIAVCTLPGSIVREIQDGDLSDLNIKTVQLCIAEATYADRSVKAQGIINPTMFNTWDRHNKRTYSVSSWISRPRGAKYSNRHFAPIDSASSSTGEIACNWWPSNHSAPRPFYQYSLSGSGREYVDSYLGVPDYDYLMVAYNTMITATGNYLFCLTASILKLKIKPGGDVNLALAHHFDTDYVGEFEKDTTIFEDDNCTITCYVTPMFTASTLTHYMEGVDAVHAKLADYFRTKLGMTEAMNEMVSREQVEVWFGQINHGIFHGVSYAFHTVNGYQDGFSSWKDCWNDGQTTPSAERWEPGANQLTTEDESYIPAFYTKQFMFIDENVLTLNSPEFDYEAVDVDRNDGLKLRIVGVAKITSGYSDYTVIASPGKKPGENLLNEHFRWTKAFGNSAGLISWPLWNERNLEPREREEEEGELPDVENRTSEDYQWGGGSRRYWLHMWERNGSITGYVDPNDHEFGYLSRKVFANMKFSYATVYAGEQMKEYDLDDLRLYNYVSPQMMQLSVGGNNKYYNGNVQTSLSVPGKFKYPVMLNIGQQDTNLTIESDQDWYLYVDEPVQIEYLSNPHAVFSLPTYNGNQQRILPYLFDNDGISDYIPAATQSRTGAYLPWEDSDEPSEYSIMEEKMTVPGIQKGDMYLFIGELYQTYQPGKDTRYGGTTDTDIENCRFIAAGPQFLIEKMKADERDFIFANQGDTFFQRWDCLKTKPYSIGSVNNVIDITSVMVETHINIDGRTDLLRGINELASIDATKFGVLNPVYSQANNYRIQRDMDEDFSTDAYRSSITWSLEKHDSENIDEWSHVTLASSLKLDGDKGKCRALRRLNNSIIAFQDRGISEILFNSRTQLSTQDGVPVEIANSGKVDGKRYITNKYGCTNKWSIVEGKSALYFVDNINKSFCAFTGGAVDNLSTKLGFGIWFKDINDLTPWMPSDFNNVVAYYDRVHSDVYLVRKTDDEMPCLVYSETLGAFTSFFDYNGVLMMTNVEDRFVSYKNHRMWLQNEGLYCNFFGKQYDYWVQYRVTPDQFADKIWTNIDYRADYYNVLDAEGNSVIPEEYLINGDSYESIGNLYDEWETFTDYKVWNEYQTTGFVPFAHDSFNRDDVRKKFRIWRLTIPRALKEGTNRHGMDRIRNQWINLLFRKNVENNRQLMQLHDIVVKYFE